LRITSDVQRFFPESEWRSQSDHVQIGLLSPDSLGGCNWVWTSKAVSTKNEKVMSSCWTVAIVLRQNVVQNSVQGVIDVSFCTKRTTAQGILSHLNEFIVTASSCEWNSHVGYFAVCDQGSLNIFFSELVWFQIIFDEAKDSIRIVVIHFLRHIHHEDQICRNGFHFAWIEIRRWLVIAGTISDIISYSVRQVRKRVQVVIIVSAASDIDE